MTQLWRRHFRGLHSKPSACPLSTLLHVLLPLPTTAWLCDPARPLAVSGPPQTKDLEVERTSCRNLEGRQRER